MKTYDVAIVGGGVIGASIAFELASEKLRVVVLDRQQPGQEASWAAAGMLSPAPDSPRDIPLVPLSRESLRFYPDFVAAVEEVSGASAAYAREGALEIFSAPGGEVERDRRVAECEQLGLLVEPVSIAIARRWEKAIGPAGQAAAWLPDEGTVEPRSLMQALLTAAQRRGAEIRANCPVTELLTEPERCVGVITPEEEIGAGQVVIAAGCFSGTIGNHAELLARLAPTHPVRGQMIELRTEGTRLRRVLRSERGYLVPRRHGRIVAGSTSEEAGFEKRVTPGGMRRIFDAAIELFPDLGAAEVVETWSGLRPGTPDDLPILGQTDIEGLLIATGHYRNGILLAPVTAKLVREWITGERPAFDAQAYSPLRFSSRKLHLQQAR